MITLRVAILTGSGTTIVEPLIKAGINIIGLSEVNDTYGRMGLLRKWLEVAYWTIIKRKKAPYLSLLAAQNKISYLEKHNSDAYVNWLNMLKPDILILHQAPILASEIFSIPRRGTINIHPSLLPKYRGSNPYFWMYYDQDFNAGITLHYIDESVDTGAIINQGAYTMAPGTHYSEVAHKLVHDFAMPMLIDALKILDKDNELNVTPQTKDSPTPYAKRISDKEFYQLLGFEEWDIERLWHVLHANEQWRAVFLTSIKHSNWYAWSLGGVEKTQLNQPYGEIDRDSQGYYIKHRQGKIYLNHKFKIAKFIKSFI